MKVLHINTYDDGGAGLGVLNLHRALLQAGVESRVLVAKKRSEEVEVYEAPHPQGLRFLWPRCKPLKILQTMFYRWGLLPSADEPEKWMVKKAMRKAPCYYTRPVTSYRLQEHPLVQAADIVHLHWVADFVDYRSFFAQIKKPIVWTIRDENIGYGGFHYSHEYEELHAVYDRVERNFLRVKRQALSNTNIHAVALTEEMRQFVKRQPFAQNKWNVRVIPNAIDACQFRPIDKYSARKKLGIETEDIVVAFCSYSLSDKRKGLSELIAALEAIGNGHITLLCAGIDDFPGSTNINMQRVGLLTNPNELAYFYASCDIFCTPAFEEAFGKTTVEALFCGRPVVAFPTGIAQEIINQSNGVLAQACTVTALKEALLTALSQSYNPDIIRNEVLDRFSPDRVAQQYIELYNEILS